MKLQIDYCKFQIANWAAGALVVLAGACAGCQRGDRSVKAPTAAQNSASGVDDSQRGPSQLVESARSGASPVSPASYQEFPATEFPHWDPLQQSGVVPIGERSFLRDAEAAELDAPDYPSTGIEFWDPLQDTMSPSRQAALPIEVE